MENTYFERKANKINRKTSILSIKEKTATKVDQVGVKAANLAVLKQAGFQVPDAIVVPTSYFAHHINEVLNQENNLKGKALQNAIMATSIDRLLKEDLKIALDAFEETTFAVRSSGTAEDLEGASFAGQYDTFLNVKGLNSIIEAVKKCWASAFSPHILTYLDDKEVLAGGMGVIIQPLISADSAGVVFTANPVTHNQDEVIVNAVKGIGERLVSGEAIPDEWIVTEDQAIAKKLPEKALNEGQVKKIAALARQIESYYQTPQDIEWAIRKSMIYILQARPITTLKNETEENNPVMIPIPIDVPEGYWEREESHFPDPLMPATRTTFTPVVNRAFRIVCEEKAEMIEGLEQREIGGWIYQRTVPLGGKGRKAPPKWLLPLLIRIVPQLRNRIAGSLKAVREDLVGQWLDAWEFNWKKTLVDQANQLNEIKLTSLTDHELVKHLGKAYDFLEYSLELHMKLNGAIQNILAEFAFSCKEVLNWDEEQMMLLLSGLSQMSSAPSRELAKLAEYVQTQPELKQKIKQGVAITELKHDHPEFYEKFSNYLKEFGQRSIKHELAFPTIAETPNTILGLLRNQLQVQYHPDQDETYLMEQRKDQLNQVDQILKHKSPDERARFKRILSRAQKAYPLREEHGFYDRDTPLAILRYAFLEVGRRLMVRGDLTSVDDVFFLEFNEALDAIENDNLNIKTVIEKRKGQRNWALAHPGPASYGTPPPPPPAMEAFPKEVQDAAKATFWTIEKTFAARESSRVQKDATRIEGIAVSSGRYTGKVRIIHNESEFSKIEPGDVLVCQITSPSWSILFPIIGALITDSGGILSHSAIIAREYRIPGVVATGNATELLKDGQLVTVDGNKGIVEAKPDA
ncbi:MAG: hypothetical protein H0Z32_12125 [Bacillaceae bacterium]|nr:hypothetical protein [Bacillaceae bacterium]